MLLCCTSDGRWCCLVLGPPSEASADPPGAEAASSLGQLGLHVFSGEQQGCAALPGPAKLLLPLSSGRVLALEQQGDVLSLLPWLPAPPLLPTPLPSPAAPSTRQATCQEHEGRASALLAPRQWGLLRVSRLACVGPVQDMAVADLLGQGRPQLYMVASAPAAGAAAGTSGSGRTSGTGLAGDEAAALEQGCRGDVVKARPDGRLSVLSSSGAVSTVALWPGGAYPAPTRAIPLASSTSDRHHSLLLLSYLAGTRVLLLLPAASPSAHASHLGHATGLGSAGTSLPPRQASHAAPAAGPSTSASHPSPSRSAVEPSGASGGARHRGAQASSSGQAHGQPPSRRQLHQQQQQHQQLGCLRDVTEQLGLDDVEATLACGLVREGCLAQVRKVVKGSFVCSA